MEMAVSILTSPLNKYKFDSAVTDVTPVVLIYVNPSGERVGLQPSPDGVVLLNDKDVSSMQAGHSISPELDASHTLSYPKLFVKVAADLGVKLQLPAEITKKAGDQLAMADAKRKVPQ
jgi:hypothetical protein